MPKPILLTVHSNGVWYENDHERQMYEEVTRLTGMTVVEVARMARAIVVADIDPIRAEGERIALKEKVPGLGDDIFCWISSEVPAPDANVDLLHAMERMREDNRACASILDNNPSIQEVLGVMANVLAWLRFMAVRALRPDGRAWYAREVREFEASLRWCLDEALRRGWRAREVAERLEEMLR